MWAGLAPVYAKACILALRGGPHRKPEYVVTRKHDEFAWYWRETLPHTVFLLLLLGTLAYSLATTSLASDFDVGSAYWALFFGILIGGFVRKSWFGVDLRRSPADPTAAPPRLDEYPAQAHGGRFDRTRAPASTHIGVD